MASIQSTSAEDASSPSGSEQTFRGPFAIMTSLLFLWGFMTVFNDVLIPRFKEAFELDYFCAMLVQVAFLGACLIGAPLYFIISVTKGNPIARLGYKNGVVVGLLISATGSVIFWPAATLASFPLFLTGLFVAGLGFAMLQIAANPYVSILGSEKTASSRLNLAQAFNLEDPVQLETFLKGDTREITIPDSGRKLQYDPLARVGVGMSRLGKSEAVTVGAYAFALKKMDQR